MSTTLCLPVQFACVYACLAATTHACVCMSSCVRPVVSDHLALAALFVSLCVGSLLVLRGDFRLSRPLLRYPVLSKPETIRPSLPRQIESKRSCNQYTGEGGNEPRTCLWPDRITASTAGLTLNQPPAHQGAEDRELRKRPESDLNLRTGGFYDVCPSQL
ncbi:hypothetical protein NDU88_005064 [Pleurodeles waltl]|uniref:Uncharacterized protein n=1 Tax=Pleurodeles waltl TaxID=8319 RepID=A0AAV7MZ20_PLEWA|nr:hypothetical protein NDU88_005064 [Pleurodeles waltl]